MKYGLCTAAWSQRQIQSIFMSSSTSWRVEFNQQKTCWVTYSILQLHSRFMKVMTFGNDPNLLRFSFHPSLPERVIIKNLQEASELPQNLIQVWNELCPKHYMTVSATRMDLLQIEGGPWVLNGLPKIVLSMISTRWHISTI